MPIVSADRIQQFQAINLLLDPGAVGGPVVIPSCAQIKLWWLLEGGKVGHNILYGRYSGAFAGTETQANAMLAALTSSGAWAPFAAFLATSTSLFALSLKNVAIPNQPEIMSTSGAGSGSSASAALPDEVAVCVTLRTANAGRSGRGRFYIPGFATNALGTGNVIAGGAVTAIQNWASIISGAINTQGYVFVLGLRERQAYTGSTGTAHPARPATSIPITSTGIRDNHWDSQRRRGLN